MKPPPEVLLYACKLVNNNIGPEFIDDQTEVIRGKIIRCQEEIKSLETSIALFQKDLEVEVSKRTDIQKWIAWAESQIS